MVRKYIRKSQRKSWSADTMKLAIEAVIQKNYSIRRASMEHKVPQATLSRKVNQIRTEPEKDIDVLANPFGSNFQTVFNKEQEAELCQFIHTLEDQFISLNNLDIRQLAYQVAERFNIPHRFNKNSAVAGEDWYRGFLKRNPEVCIKKLDSYEKVTGMRKEKVYKFFDLLEGIASKHQLEASDIYNLDETVITCSLRTSNDTATVTENLENSNSSHSKLVTATVCFSASGTYLPLMLIFPCSNRNKNIINSAPFGAWAEFDQSGQMQLDIFINWLRKFIYFSKATKDSPVLLIVDGYRTYLKKLQVLELAKENGINILCLPPHCTEKLQPMRQDFMKTLSAAYTAEVAKWMLLNSESTVSIQEVYQLFGNAFMKVSTVASPIDGFHNTGIWPADRDRFENEFIQVTKEGLKTTTKPLKNTINETGSISIRNDIISKRPAAPTVISKNIVHEPIVVITQDCSQPYVVQSLETITEQNQNLIQQTIIQQSFNEPEAIEHYSIIDEQTTESARIDNQTSDIDTIHEHVEGKVCSAIIPPEAQLSEVQIEDIQNLIRSQRKLHFYVSPCKLNLLR